MTNTIQTYEELLRERRLLENQLEFHREGIADEVEKIREQLRPVAGALKAAKKITSIGNGSPMIKTALGVGAGFLLKKMFLGQGGWIGKLAMPLVASTVASIARPKKNGKNFLHKLGEKLKGESR